MAGTVGAKMKKETSIGDVLEENKKFGKGNDSWSSKTLLSRSVVSPKITFMGLDIWDLRIIILILIRISCIVILLRLG